MKHTSIFSRAILLGVLTLFAGSMLLGSAQPARAASLSITGYAWSSYLGWIHFNGSNYGVMEDSQTGMLSGYAWSPYFGSISFNAADLSGCPSGTCEAKVDVSTGKVTGWARSCAAFSSKTGCNGTLETGAGGWDGWIHLTGSSYGVTSTNGCWTGYANGAQDIGYIHFNGDNYKVGDPTCGAATCSNGASNPPACTVKSDGTCLNNATNPPTCTTFSGTTAILSVSPTAVAHGAKATLTWSSGGGATSCTAGGPWSTSGNLSGSGLTDPILADTTFTLQCTGPGGTSAIASATVTVGAQTCSNGTNNPPACTTKSDGTCLNGANNPPTCSSYTSPTVSLVATPDTIDVGQSSVLTWSSSNASTCVSSGGFDTGGATTNSTGVSVSPIITSNYGITCTGIGGPSSAIATVTVLQPTVSISASPTRVATGSGATSISWSSSQVTSCAVTKNGVAWKTGLSSSGTPDPAVTTQTTYKLTCQTKGNPISKSTIVNVMPAFQEF